MRAEHDNQKTTELRHLVSTYTIGSLCREFKCTPRAVRFYEEKGLLDPVRRGLDRLYSSRDRARLVLILRGRRVGLSIADIREILELYGADQSGGKQAVVAFRKFQARIAALEHQTKDIDDTIVQLRCGVSSLERRIRESNTQPQRYGVGHQP